MYSCEKPGIKSALICGMWVLDASRFLKLSIAVLRIFRAMVRAWCSSNSMWVAPLIFTFGEVVMILVWKFSASPTSACMMHCTSTTIASTAPVMMASS